MTAPITEEIVRGMEGVRVLEELFERTAEWRQIVGKTLGFDCKLYKLAETAVTETYTEVLRSRLAVLKSISGSPFSIENIADQFESSWLYQHAYPEEQM